MVMTLLVVPVYCCFLLTPLDGIGITQPPGRSVG